MLTGQNGILTQSQNAKDSTRGGDVQETVNLAITENQMAEYTNGTKKSRTTVIDELKADGKLTDEEVEKLKESNTIKIGNITVDFSGLGSVSGAKTLVEAFKKGDINRGDYITNYNATLKNKSATVDLTTEETGYDGGTQSYKVDTNTTWRVLGLSEDGTKLVITTGSPIKREGTDPYLYLDKAEGWYNTNDELVPGNNILDKICEIYDGEYASSTKSMRIEDINNALGLTLDTTANTMYKKADTSKTPLTAFVGMFGTSYTYKSGDYAPENYLKQKYGTKYSSLTNKKIGDPVDGTFYYYDYTDSSIVKQGSKLYEVLFKGTTSTENYAKSYWLASSGSPVNGTDFCCFGPGAVYGGIAFVGSDFFCSDGISFARWMAVRPVVSLKSDVTIDDLSVSNEGSEANWTTSLPDSYTGESLTYGQIQE